MFELEEEADTAGVQPSLMVSSVSWRLHVRLATEPKLLLLDEPAAGMNPNETEALMDMIRFVRDHFNMTVLLIEHDMRLVSGICEELTVLNFGEVLAQGRDRPMFCIIRRLSRHIWVSKEETDKWQCLK